MFTKRGRLRLIRAQWRSFTHSTIVSAGTFSAYEVGEEGMHVWASVHAFAFGSKIYERHGNDFTSLLVDMNAFIAGYKQGLQEKRDKALP